MPSDAELLAQWEGAASSSSSGPSAPAGVTDIGNVFSTSGPTVNNSPSDEDLLAQWHRAAPVSTTPSWGQSASYVGKNLVAGAGNLLGMGIGAMPGNPFATRPGGASGAISGLLKKIGIDPSPEASGLAPTLPTKVIGGAAQGALFPGGQVVNAIGGAGSVLGAEAMPEHPVIGSILGGVGAGLLGSAAGGLANSLSGGVEKAGQAFERSSIGATARNFIKSQKDKGLLIDTEADEIATKLSNAIKEIGDTEGFGFLRDPARLAIRNKKVLERDGKAIGTALTFADDAGVVPKLDLTSPESATQKLISSSHADRADIKNVIDEVKSKLLDPENGWDGTLSGLNKWKSSFGNTGFKASIEGTTKPAIERKALQAVYRDIDTAIKQGVTKSGIATADEWAATMKRYSNHKELEPVLNHAASSELGGTLATASRGLLRTSGGTITTPTLIGGALAGTGIGAPAGLAVGGALSLLTSPTGSGLAGNVLKAIGKTGKVLTSTDENNLVNLLKAVTKKGTPGGSIPPTGGGSSGMGSLLNQVTGQADNEIPGLGSASTLRPSQVTGPTGTFLPESSTAETMPSLTDTVKYLPSNKYSPDISVSKVLSDSDFISHYDDTTKALPELEDFIKQYAGSNPVKVGVKDLETAAGKIVRKNQEGKNYTEADLGDLIRGSISAKDGKDALKTLEAMKASGQVQTVEDYFTRPNIWGYKGINLNIKTKSGAIGEIQIHAPESEVIKKAIRPVYEKFRNAEDIPVSVYRQSRRLAKTAEESFGKGKEVGLKSPSNFQVGKMADGDTFDVSYPIVEVPLKGLKLSDEVPNFKAGANERGIVDELQGDFERRGLGPIAVWERKSGAREVISGRHRWDLADRTGQKSIPAQIYKESEGFTAQDARRLDAELNILSENGSIGDYSRYFKNSDLTQAEAFKKGLISRSKGKAGYAIGKDGSEEIYSLHQSGKIGDAEALAIVKAAPGDANLQRAAISAVNEGVSAQDLPNFLDVVKKIPKSESTQGELFGHDNSAVNSGIALSKAAAAERKVLTTEINAVQNAAKNPEIAKKYDIDVKDPQGVSAKVKDLKLERDKWEEWSKHPDLMEKLKKGLKNEKGSIAPDLMAGTALGGLLAKTMGSKEENEAEIKKDPWLSLSYFMESSNGKFLKNPESSASGPFQMINATAKAVGVNAKDLDFTDDIEGMKKLKAEYLSQGIKNDPIALYAAHYLGVPTLKKWQNGDNLTAKQQKQVDDLQNILIPRAKRFLKKQTGQVEA